MSQAPKALAAAPKDKAPVRPNSSPKSLMSGDRTAPLN
jgi:hypothetical protein